MKFKIGDILYYVNPFIFVIDKVIIEFLEEDEFNGQNFCIDHSGAYLQEENLFYNLNSAQTYAISELGKFYDKKMLEILQSKPELEIDDED